MEGIRIIRYEESVYYANVDNFKYKVMKLSRINPDFIKTKMSKEISNEIKNLIKKYKRKSGDKNSLKNEINIEENVSVQVDFIRIV